MNMHRFGVVIQARTNSSRFPKKIVQPVDGEMTFLHFLVERLSVLKNDIPIFIATSDTEADDIIEQIGNSLNIPVFRGSENNVLNRFIQCATKFKVDAIVRVCSDNPFIDIASLKKLIATYKGEDYLSYSINNTPSILTHYGFFAELVSLHALKKVEQQQTCQEHVTNCLYTNKDLFNVAFIPLHISSSSIRCTLDTEIDFEVLKRIYFEWYKNTVPEKLDYTNLIKFIEENPSLMLIMKDQIKQNTK